jgi:hypothetical protein
MSSSPRLAVLTWFWYRPVVSAIYWAGIARLRKTFTFDVVAVCSPGDTENIELAERYATRVIVTDNDPLSAKQNAGMRAARSLSPDYVAIIASDDLASNELFHWFESVMSRRLDFAGVLDLYVYSAERRALRYWRGYGIWRHGSVLGPFRIYSARVLDRLGWEPWNVQLRTRGQDRNVDGRLSSMGIEPDEKVRLADIGALAIDIKTADNLTIFDKYIGDDVPLALLDNHLSPLELRLLRQLRHVND